jgi:hypothetical protein
MSLGIPPDDPSSLASAVDPPEVEAVAVVPLDVPPEVDTAVVPALVEPLEVEAVPVAAPPVEPPEVIAVPPPAPAPLPAANTGAVNPSRLRAAME